MTLLQVTHVNVTDSNGNKIDPIPVVLPDAAGPPETAETTEAGIRFVYLAHGEKKRLPTPNDKIALVATAYVVDGIEVKLLKKGIKSATTLDRAPGRLAEVLKLLSPGDQVRVWFPRGQGKAVIPDTGELEAIVDLSVSF